MNSYASKDTSFIIDLDKVKNSNTLHTNAYKMGINIKQRNYLLLSLKLYKSVKGCGLYRKGIWNKEQLQWTMYKSIQKEKHVASQHPLIWSEFYYYSIY